ncbi:MAG: type II secretion system protein [Smithella sp.]
MQAVRFSRLPLNIKIYQLPNFLRSKTMAIKNILRSKSFAVREKQNHSHGTEIKRIKSQKGFTLIEVITTLVIVGVMAALGGMGIVQAVKGYITVKQNSETTQKFQMALTRINREIREMISTSTATGTTISMTGVNNCFSSTNCVRTIGLNNGAIKITSGGTNLANGDILIDNVNSFNISYYKEGNTQWTSADDQTLLAGVKVDMSINLPGGGTLGGIGGGLLPSNIAPRNNGNLGGVAPPAYTPYTLPPPTGWGCFVATAAYGNPWHPMVQVLRDFRDRHLVNWPGGKWFIKEYYAHGPAAADMIRNRPIAMFAVRCLLAPAAALIFCLMYAPLVIPFVFIVSLFVTTAVFAVFRRKLTISSGILRSRGSILIGLIFTMVIMAVLAAAMLPMFSSSYMNQFYTDQGRKAYFLAESGFAYAALQYREADTETAKDAALADMQGKAYSLDDAGKFTNRFYPYWFKITAIGSDISAQVPAGYVPSNFGSLKASGYMRVCTGGENSTCGVYSYHDVTVTSNSTINFNGASKISGSSAAVGSYVMPSARSNASTVTNGKVNSTSKLTLKNNTGGDAFPEYNGTFTISPSPSGINSGLVFRYQKKVGNELQNITLADPRKTWYDFSVANNTNIALNKFLVLSSTGQSLGGFSREVIYNTPVGDSSGSWVKAQFLAKNGENFITAANQSIGTHSVSGGKLQVTDVVNPQDINTGSIIGNWIGTVIKSFLQAFYVVDRYPGVWAITAWDWTNTETNLAQGFSDAGGALSYDIQVKIDNSTKPYFSNGIGFRLRSNATEDDIFGYGVSIIRQRQTACANTFFGTCNLSLWESNWGSTIPGYCLESSGASPINDGIDGDLRPLTSYSGEEQIWCNRWAGIVVGAAQYERYSEPAIVLWQRNGPAASGEKNFKVLAYRIIQPQDGLTYCWSGAATCTGSDLRLKPWVTLMVRVIEGYELTFSSGRVDASGSHLKYGDTVQIRDGSGNVKAIGRVMGTPVMSTAWGSNDTTSGAGTLMLTNLSAKDIASGDDIYMNGSSYATATSSITSSSEKTNHIMVYYSDNKTPVAGDTTQANNTRIGNVLYTTETQANWPPHDQTNATAGLPTDTPAGNDYFSLVQWHYITPGSNQVDESNWPTDVVGWKVAGSGSSRTLRRVKSLGPSVGPSLTSGWTTVGNWDYSDGGLHHYNETGSTRDKSASINISTTSNTVYDVSVTVHRTGGIYCAYYDIGSDTNNDICPSSGTKTYPNQFTSGSGSTTNIFVSAQRGWGATIQSFSVWPWVTPGTETLPLEGPLTAGTTFTVSFTVSDDFDAGESLSYSIGGFNYTVTSNGTHTAEYTATANVNNIVFSSPSGGINDQFTISNISVIPSVISGTLDTTADCQGNVASYVPAVASSDFYQAVIKTGAMVSPDGSTYTDFMDGGADIIALMTASYHAPETDDAGTSFYDDFAVQMDTKTSQGFLPPVQQ